MPVAVTTLRQVRASSIRVRAAAAPNRRRRAARSIPQAQQEIELLLGDRPRRRDLLIEHLHLIQDKYHQISAAHLAALADEMRLAFAEVFETATFYAHFDVVKEGEPDIAPLTIRVCDSLTCAMLGARKAARRNCRTAPGRTCASCARPASAAAIPRRPPRSAITSSITRPSQSVLAAAKAGDTHAHLPNYVDYDAYVADGGYALLNALRSGELTKEDLLKSLDDASCAASAARASRRDANGARCSASPARG